MDTTRRIASTAALLLASLAAQPAAIAQTPSDSMQAVKAKLQTTLNQHLNRLLSDDGSVVSLKGKTADGSGALAFYLMFEITGSGGGPRHLHHAQDEWIYIVEGQFDFVVGKKQFRAAAGESVFIPRKVAHIWGTASGQPGKVINSYQPAGKMEDFFRELGKFSEVGNYRPELPTREQMVNNTYTDEQVQWLRKFFAAHGMDLLGPN
jgi:mannose-6-phosphate isomerase-like protein (cupin superfamily)